MVLVSFNRFCLLLALLLGSLISSTAAEDIPDFTEVAGGIEYRLVHLDSPRPLVLHQLRCDPKKVRFGLALASDLKGKPDSARAPEIQKAFPATAILNCSYFDHSYQILGYTERLGHVLAPEVPSDGIFSAFFYWDGSRAGLKRMTQSRPSGVPVLLQAGPRLVWDGQPVPGLNDAAPAARSGVSLDDQGRVTLFALGGTSMTTLAELPALLRAPEARGGVGSMRALNFDGGSSTQFLLTSETHSTYLPGINSVPIFLTVSPR